ncbi:MULTISPECIES: bifunctional phosphopantothenoylcysteine decarboxylase/phosphopantothenate--cysteine ligase CoaBC [Micromonospora]|uniref:bifunctional phosphopantothenoylcysteine decarboxylase/phosphopantothenate--cysteine ligase CoaBC n=1 Tax=Micromonospora TaxID=1873 RepID=UPI001EE85EE3|nr:MULTISPECIES: bifunctional phosphopantothenoylcysteine decarboxylase/phosphopantothenate--cysteine ligase CoaBC [Micromonospora]MCG5451918.1 bifunctional phosphopantothenoylcysteine decarboxylase/phosphopantothenate--cysteine ligase CoaBC [Micromonospora hortensis]MCX5117368.1 bifunctional phosphopantothenoylcysteine decarboxylase/phosphopantothenate--cysteine ligase CoaBC [Micromonospora sp. NBC_00362]WTI10539.1 bifunctional phosphopantothenoylcysteine decarboxylase/phosphopantothenate--cyst
MSASIVLGVGGGIAAYKACELLRLFTESGHRVRVVPTASALRFVGAPTWAALSGQPVADDVWTDVHEVPHVRLGKQADLVVVAPTTTDLLAKAAHGLADDLLTNTLLTARCPVLLAPAMHTEMWEHPATVANVATLRSRGVRVIEPAVGRLTGADTGKGRLPDPAEIFAVAGRLLARGDSAPADLAGRRVVVTAGGTREPLDPVRFLGNRSSGKQGYAFARAAVARGARVTVISANVGLADPAGVDLIRVGTTAELREATVKAAVEADAVVMAAAPADFRPATYATGKIKKSDDGVAPTIELVTNPDIAAELGQRKRPGQVLVVFAAETGDAEANGRAKLARKRADLIVVNEVGPNLVFGADTNTVTVIGADGSVSRLPEQAKEAVADAVWDLVVARLPGRS